MTTINEENIPIEKDISLPRTVTMPFLLFKLCKKYGVSVSEATQEGALMLLMMNDSYVNSEENLEITYKNTQSKYKDKIETFARTINKITTGRDLK